MKVALIIVLLIMTILILRPRKSIQCEVKDGTKSIDYGVKKHKTDKGCE